MRNTDAFTPNLTLNVHGRTNRWELYVVALIGTVLQLGVIVYFGFASVMFPKDGSPVAEYALPCTVLGTLLLVAGMMICSYVVESSTGETRYRPLSGREARVVWLQKSGTVNDQSFDSFAVFPTVPLEVITTSERLPVRTPKSQGGWFKGLVHSSFGIFGAETRAEAVTVIGSVVSICGYVVQFVGLRGMHWSAAVVQLGATAVMTASRAWVRRGLARLPESQTLVSGFELDWLSLTLSMNPSMAPWSRGFRDKGNNRARPWAEGGKWDWKISSLQGKADDLVLKRYPYTNSNKPTEVAFPGNKAHNIFRIRRELGKLAGWHGPASMEAINLARAIEITMDSLFNDDIDMETLSWSLPVHDELIHFRLERSSTKSWKAFADELEAALSLWLYYIDDDMAGEPNQERPVDDAGKPDLAKSIRLPKDRGNDDAWLRAEGAVGKRNLRLIDVNSLRLRRDLGWWFANGINQIMRIEKLEPNRERGTIRAEGFQMDDKESFTGSRIVEVEKHRVVGLLTGLMASEIDSDFAFSSEQSQNTILAIDSYSPLKTLLTQYMFSSFMWAAAKMLTKSEYHNKLVFRGVEVGDGPTESPWMISLHNAQLSKLAQDIQSTGIGSLEEVYISIIPPLSRWDRFPQLEEVVDAVRKQTMPLEKAHRWEEAWDTYWWFFEISRGSNVAADATALVMEHLRIVKAAKELMEDQLYENDTISNLENLISKILESLRDDQHKNPGSVILYDKIMSLYAAQHRYWDSGLQQSPWELDHADRTLGLQRPHTMALNQSTPDDIEYDCDFCHMKFADVLGWTALHYGVLVQPSTAKDRRTVYGLLVLGSDPNAQDFHGLTPFHLVCREGYHSVKIQELLRYGADVNIKDFDGRAPLHHAAEQGHKLVVQCLVEAGANINLVDSQGHTPLLWAAYKGHLGLIDDLWSDEHKKLRDHNGRTPLHIAAIGAMESEEKEKEKLEVVKKFIEKGINMEANDRFGQTPLHVAVRSGNKAVTRALLEKGANSEARTSNNETLLHMAAKGGQMDIAQVLLESGVDIEAKDSSQHTPLHKAAKAGHGDIVKLLLKNGADKHKMNARRETPLYQAVKGGDETTVRLLLDPCNDAKAKELYTNLLCIACEGGKGAVVQLLLDKGADVCAKDANGLTALHAAIDNDRVDLVQLLLDKGADTEVRQAVPSWWRNDVLKKYPGREIDNYGDTPLLLASRRGKDTIVQLLLDRGADMEAKDAEGLTPLVLATRQRRQSLAILLLSRGANKEAKDIEGRTPLFRASEASSDSGVRVLLDFGAAVNARDLKGRTPLYEALVGWKATCDKVKLLLDAGASVEVRDVEGTTPLFWAFNPLAAKQLLDQGADKEARNNDGETPLFWAVRGKWKNVINVLLDAGANIEAKDTQGRTPLFRAVEDKLEAVIQLLLDRGANKEAQNNDGETPSGLAGRKGYENIAQLLRG